MWQTKTKPKIKATERDIFKFKPIFAPNVRYETRVSYVDHRRRITQAESETDTSPPKCFIRKSKASQFLAFRGQMDTTTFENKLMTSRIARIMIEPSAIDNHMTWVRPSHRNRPNQKEMLLNTYNSLYLLKRCHETRSDYSRSKFLNQWEGNQKIVDRLGQYCHDWRDPTYTTASLCRDFKRCFPRRAQTAPPAYKVDRGPPCHCRRHITKPSDVDSRIDDNDDYSGKK